MIEGLGYDWAIEQTAKCIKELVELTGPDAALPDSLFADRRNLPAAPKHFGAPRVLQTPLMTGPPVSLKFLEALHLLQSMLLGREREVH